MNSPFTCYTNSTDQCQNTVNLHHHMLSSITSSENVIQPPSNCKKQLLSLHMRKQNTRHR